MSEEGSEFDPIGEPEASPVERNFSGWVLLTILFAIMIAGSIYSSFTPAKSASKSSAATADATSDDGQLRFEVSFRRFIDRFAQKDQVADFRQKAIETLEEPVSGLVKPSLTDLDASRIYGSMRTEQGLDVPAEHLAPLRKSKNPADHALAEIFAAKTLTKEGAWILTGKLPDDPFVFKLAKVQAQEKAGNKSIRAKSFTGRMFLSTVGISLLGFGLLVGSFFTWTILARALSKGTLKPLGMPMGAISLAMADRLALRAALVLIVFVFLDFMTSGLGQMQYAIVGLGIVAALPILARIPVGGEVLPVSRVGLSFENLGLHIAWGIGGFFFELPLMMLMAMAGDVIFQALPQPTHPVTEQILASQNLWSILPILLFGSITAPIWEEFVFRGLIFPALARVLARITTAALVTGLIFAMIHPQGIVLWMALATVGTAGCALTYQTRSLIPSIVMHMLHNTAILCITLLVMGMQSV